MTLIIIKVLLNTCTLTYLKLIYLNINFTSKMNTPRNNQDEKMVLPKIIRKSESVKNLNLYRLIRIRKNLDGIFLPEIHLTYPLTPKKNSIGRSSLSFGELDDIKSRLMFIDNDDFNSPYSKNYTMSSPTTPSTPVKSNKVNNDLILDDIEDHIYNDSDDELSIDKNLSRLGDVRKNLTF